MMNTERTLMELFVFTIGGNAGKSNIEVHDIQFVVAERPEDGAFPFTCW